MVQWQIHTEWLTIYQGCYRMSSWVKGSVQNPTREGFREFQILLYLSSCVKNLWRTREGLFFPQDCNILSFSIRMPCSVAFKNVEKKILKRTILKLFFRKLSKECLNWRTILKCKELFGAAYILDCFFLKWFKCRN